MTSIATTALYIAFAVFSLGINLAVQRAILDPNKDDLYRLVLAIASGSICALLVKYNLDKNWIFTQSKSFESDRKQFLYYSLFGIVTTIIFFVIEFLFWITFKNHLMREFGAILGASIGYYTKYKLDDKYVFRSSQKTSRI